MGVLAKKDIIHWRVPGTEIPPQPKEGEVIVFTDHLLRGFSPPGSKFFRDVLNFFQLHPQDIGPNSISNICNFQVFCEVYLQQEPTVELFREFYYLNRQTEFTDGPSLELGGISIQRRKEATFPAAKLPSHPKDWNQTWFYSQDTSPEGESPLPGYREHRLSNQHPLPDRISTKERAKYAPIFSKIRALMANGLTGIDLVRCWVSWRILPLSRRPGLMCEYTGDVKDPQRHCQIELNDKDINDMTKTLLNESLEDCSKTGLSPFYAFHKPPAANSSFWNKKLQDKPPKKTRTKHKAPKKPAKKKTNPSESLNLDDDESEDDTEGSHADGEEQHEARRTTRNSGGGNLSSGLPNTPAPRKRRPEGTSNSSSGDSTGTQVPLFKTVPGAMARPSKKLKVHKPAEDPKVTEPEKQTASFLHQTSEASMDDPPPEEHHATMDSMNVEPENAKPPSPAQPAQEIEDVIVTGTAYAAPGNPTVLSKHSAKEEISTVDKGKWKLDLEGYAKFNAQELHAGYLNRLHTSRDFEAGLVKLMKDRFEAELNMKESQVSDLRQNIQTQQSETSKAKSELKTALENIEKLRKDFSANRTGWETEKAAILKKAEDAEAALKPVTDELSDLKHQINSMTAAIFGSRVSHLGSDMRMKLKAAYTLIEQLYTGAQRAISAATHKKQPPSLIKEVLEKLSVLPQRFEELKRSAARAGAITALSRAKAWQAELDPEELATGCPSLKEDGSPFSAEDFTKIVREMRPLASKLALETDLSKYHPVYDANNAKVKAPVHEAVDLIPPTRKHTFAPDIDPSTLIDGEAVFKALTGINLATSDFQPMGEEEDEPVQDDPESSTREGQDH